MKVYLYLCGTHDDILDVLSTLGNTYAITNATVKEREDGWHECEVYAVVPEQRDESEMYDGRLL